MPLKNETGVIISMCLFYVSRSHILIAVSSRFLKQRFVKTKGTAVCVHAMKRYGGEEVQLQSFITSTPDGDECSALCTSCFIPKESTPGIHWIGGGWVGPKGSLNPLEKTTISFPSRIKPPFLSHPTGSLVAILTTQHRWRYLNNQ
jgi:hypothetical protein